MSDEELKCSLVYDEDWDLPRPEVLIQSLVGKSNCAHEIPWQYMFSSRYSLASGAGPEAAAILVQVEGNSWETLSQKSLVGFSSLVESDWFDAATRVATESLHSTSIDLENHYTKWRIKILNASVYSDEFYPLLNLVVQTSRIYLQLLFPFPISNKQARKAVALLPGILNKVNVGTWGIMSYKVKGEQWIIQGNLSS